MTLETAQLWRDYRSAREQERMHEAYRPEAIRQRYRVEQEWIDHGCLDDAELVDLGRALFQRNFTLEEGFGNNLAGREGTPGGGKPRPNLRRFQAGIFGGPDASGCFNCHWKGGFASGGDRADNAYLFGDGDDVATHDERNPPALWGAGWTEIIAREMTEELQAARAELARQAVDTGEAASGPLTAKGVWFGQLTAVSDGDEVRFDVSEIEGVDVDLVVKPFGWKGTFVSLREFTAGSLQFHMNLQAEELVEGSLATEIDLGDGPNEQDPDNDGVLREFTEGQLTALVMFLATLDTPGVHVPTEGGFVEGTFTSELDVVDTQEFTVRWLDGARQFDQLGCASCHQPLMPVSNPVYETQASLSGTRYQMDLSHLGASPRPAQAEDGTWLVPVFSDFKRHRMGSYLSGTHTEKGVPPDVYMTRRLWGLANTRPYLHDGRAVLFDEAIAAHGGEGSEARGSAEAFAALPEGRKASLRVFLLSLRRAPAIRVR